jgi:hypothetical protein
LLAQLQPDGSFRGGDDLRAYYKTPAALLAHGETRAAHRVLDYVESRYLRAGGARLALLRGHDGRAL